MEKFIRIDNIEVSQKSCTIAFNAWLNINGNSDLNDEPIQLTHRELYELLETATDVECIREEGTNLFVRFKQGIVGWIVFYQN